MANFTIKLTGGRPANSGQLKQLVERHMDGAIKRAGLAIQGSGQANTPVRTGNLRRSWATGQPEWAGTIRKVKVGPNAVYAHRVNVVGRSKGYVETGVTAGTGAARNALREGVRALGPHLWVGKA